MSQLQGGGGASGPSAGARRGRQQTGRAKIRDNFRAIAVEEAVENTKACDPAPV